MDQWRSHVLTEVISGPAKCRPLWDIVNGLRLSMCQDVLGPLVNILKQLTSLLKCSHEIIKNNNYKNNRQAE